MIKLNRYDGGFEKFYFKKVNEKVDINLKIAIINSCEKYFPTNIFNNCINNDDKFEKLILLNYNDLKYVYNYINSNAKKIMENELKIIISNYESYKSCYENVRDSFENNVKMNVLIVRENKVNVCPYCNRDYINSRADNFSGAQLDHFYSRGKYPIFSLCLYNLVPVCANCNRKKSGKDVTLISPFDESFNFYENIKFKYTFHNNMETIIEIENLENINNIDTLGLTEAYSINTIEVDDLLNKKVKYSQSQIKEIVKNINIDESDLKELIFGKELTEFDFGRKPLSKLQHDILEELGVYK